MYSKQDKKPFHIFIRVLFAKYDEKKHNDILKLFSFKIKDEDNLGVIINSDEEMLDDIRKENYEFIDYENSVYSLGSRDEVTWRLIFSYISKQEPRIFLSIGFYFLKKSN